MSKDINIKQKETRITPAEWPVMEILWNCKTATAAEIVSSVSAQSGAGMRTVKTMIRRLVEKGAVSYTIDSQDTRVYHYYANVTRQTCTDTKTEALLKTVFNNNSSDMLLGFLNNTKLSLSEIQKLEKLLKEKRDELNHDN